MKLPNALAVQIEQRKITEYLLNPEHPDNGGKAEFFLSLGFRRDYWEQLTASFHTLVQTHSVTRSMESAHGKKYIVEGTFETPIGKSPTVRTVWFVDAGEAVARLVTAYPLRKKK
jgi:hypothetical protein